MRHAMEYIAHAENPDSINQVCYTVDDRRIIRPIDWEGMDMYPPMHMRETASVGLGRLAQVAAQAYLYKIDEANNKIKNLEHENKVLASEIRELRSLLYCRESTSDMIAIAEALEMEGE
jgi:hypothetical protein